jgi:hypothetical protein
MDKTSQLPQAPESISVRFAGTDIRDFLSQDRQKDMSFRPCPFMDLRCSGLGFRIAAIEELTVDIQELFMRKRSLKIAFTLLLAIGLLAATQLRLSGGIVKRSVVAVSSAVWGT